MSLVMSPRYNLFDMKTIKNSFFDGALNVVTKVSEIKGDPNSLNLKIYITDEHGFKKTWIPKSVIEKVLGTTIQDDTKKLKWQVNFFVDGDIIDHKGWYYHGEERHLIDKNKGWHFPLWYYAEGSRESYGFGNTPHFGFNIGGINVNRDYYSLTVDKSTFLNGSISIKLIYSAEKLNRFCEGNIEYRTIFTISGNEANISGQRKANCRGYNDEVEEYLLAMNGLRGLPKLSSVNEYRDWYGTINQNYADIIRSSAKHYFDMLWSQKSNATSAQIKFIKKNCLALANEHGGIEGLTKAKASAIIDTFINYSNKA